MIKDELTRAFARDSAFILAMEAKGLQVSQDGTLFLKTVSHDNYIIKLKIETPPRRLEEREANFYDAVGYLQGLLHEVVSARADIEHSVEKKKKGIE